MNLQSKGNMVLSANQSLSGHGYPAGGRINIIANSGFNICNIDDTWCTIGTNFLTIAPYGGANNLGNPTEIDGSGANATFNDLYYFGSFGSLSDQRLKKNVTDISGGTLQLIEQLRPVTYEWNDLHNQLYKSQDSGSNFTGFIAQEVESVFPLAVGLRPNVGSNVSDFKTIQPLVLIPYLVKAIQELSAQVKALQPA